METESFQYLTTGKMRFIGVTAKDDSWTIEEILDEDKLRSQVESLMPQLNELKKEYATDIPYLCSLNHDNHKECGVDECIMAGFFFKEGTPVPDGADYFDIISDDIGYGIYTTYKFQEDRDNAYVKTRDRILGDGNLVPYPIGYWDAVVHTNGFPHDGKYRFGYIFPAVVNQTYEAFLEEVGAK